MKVGDRFINEPSGLIAVIVAVPGDVHPMYGMVPDNKVIVQCPGKDGEGKHVSCYISSLESGVWKRDVREEFKRIWQEGE